MVTSLTEKWLKGHFGFRRGDYFWLFWCFRKQSPFGVNAFPESPPVLVKTCTFCNELIVVIEPMRAVHAEKNERAIKELGRPGQKGYCVAASSLALPTIEAILC